MGIDGAGVDLEGILHDGNDGGYRGDGKHNPHEQQDDIMRLGKEGLDLIAPHGGGIGLQGCGFIHGRVSPLLWGVGAAKRGNAPGAAVGRDPGARSLLLNRSQG